MRRAPPASSVIPLPFANTPARMYPAITRLPLLLGALETTNDGRNRQQCGARTED